MENNLKLNVKRTMFIGLAFFTILMLWQVYNYYAPPYLAINKSSKNSGA